MAGPDTKNAHVRGDGKRGRAEQSQKSIDADRLLNDPAFQDAMASLQEAIVNLIVETQSDGSPEAAAAEREMCRTLRTMKRIPRILLRVTQGEQLRLADFRSHEPEKTA